MRRRVRAPFVVTAAVTAVSVIGCGDASRDCGQGACNPPLAMGDTATPPFDVPPSLDVPSTESLDADANPAECPTDDPGIGARQTCTAPLSVQCSYVDLCPSHPGADASNVYVCKDDGTGKHWTLVSDAYVPDCPKTQPKDGDPCPCTIHMGYTACNYGVCADDATIIYAACKGVDTFDPVWHVKSIACNPPEPDAGFIDAIDDTTSDSAD